ncbi:MAG: hypothetical protein KDC44_21290, partial [Phaeodactylibacter sp.]|nr:hypothetical protein [Phaeodactylibacter sp.]
MKVSLTFLFLLCIHLPFIQGQSPEPLSKEARDKQAIETIQQLKSGALIVRLATEHRKLSTLQEMLDNGESSGSRRARIEEQIDQTIFVRDAQNRGLVAGFRNFYTFSDVYFIYDTAFHQLQQDLGQGYLLNDSLEIDPSIKVEQPVYLVRFGSTDPASTAKIEDGLIIMDTEGKDLSDPFPYYAWIFTPKRALKYNLLNKEEQYRL